MSKLRGPLLAIAILSSLPGCGGVTHYENKVDPQRDLEKDKYECTTDAVSKAHTEVPTTIRRSPASGRCGAERVHAVHA